MPLSVAGTSVTGPGEGLVSEDHGEEAGTGGREGVSGRR